MADAALRRRQYEDAAPNTARLGRFGSMSKDAIPDARTPWSACVSKPSCGQTTRTPVAWRCWQSVCHYIIEHRPLDSQIAVDLTLQTKEATPFSFTYFSYLPLPFAHPPSTFISSSHRLHVLEITAAILIRPVLRIDKASALRSAHLQVTHEDAVVHI